MLLKILGAVLELTLGIIAGLIFCVVFFYWLFEGASWVVATIVILIVLALPLAKLFAFVYTWYQAKDRREFLADLRQIKEEYAKGKRRE